MCAGLPCPNREQSNSKTQTNKQTYLWVALEGGVASEKSVKMLTADANVPSYETMDHGQCQALPDRAREVDKERERERGEMGERQAASTACTSAINPVPDSFK